MIDPEFGESIVTLLERNNFVTPYRSHIRVAFRERSANRWRPPIGFWAKEETAAGEGLLSCLDFARIDKRKAKKAVAQVIWTGNLAPAIQLLDYRAAQEQLLNDTSSANPCTGLKQNRGCD